jgi:hypothetical protein
MFHRLTTTPRKQFITIITAVIFLSGNESHFWLDFGIRIDLEDIMQYREAKGRRRLARNGPIRDRMLAQNGLMTRL